MSTKTKTKTKPKVALFYLLKKGGKPTPCHQLVLIGNKPRYVRIVVVESEDPVVALGEVKPLDDESFINSFEV